MHYFLFLVYSSLTGIGVLGFSKIEIERKHQRNFQTDFIKLILKYKGVRTEERRSSEVAQQLALLGCFYKLGTKQAYVKRWAF